MMLQDQNIFQETYYGILCVEEDASYEEIRASYRNAILKYHPDKIHSLEGLSNSDPRNQDTFHKIQKAWSTLSCTSLRALYDSELKAARKDHVMADDVPIEGMIAVDDGEAVGFHYQCSCGDYFSTDSFELESAGYTVKKEKSEVSLRNMNGMHTAIILPCPSCSLKVRLLIDSDTRLIIDD